MKMVLRHGIRAQPLFFIIIIFKGDFLLCIIGKIS